MLKHKRNEIDLKIQSGITSGIEVCFLAEDSKRITSETFKVYIPSLMGGIENNGAEPSDTQINLSDIILNEENNFSTSIQTGNYIEALNFTSLGHRLDGWIPKFRIEKMTAQSGSIQKQSAGSTKGVTQPAGEGPHVHDIKMPMDLKNNSLNQIVFNNIVMTNSYEVDFQELNNKFIKRGHMMIGTFINGIQNVFVILAIYNSVPRLTEIERKGSNADNPDTSIDGNLNPPN